MIGRIERVHLRDVWRHEALDFTRWLEENVEVLNEALDLNLTTIEREKDAGEFVVDLVAEDDSGRIVVIENQLGKSDHDHLGKLITYVAAINAQSAIWITSEPRPEHVNAISWLNQTGVATFYLVKLEAIRIGNSEPAPLLTLIVGPSQESNQIGQTKKETVERHKLRRRFWAGLLEYAKTKTKLHTGISPSNDNWIATGAGISGLSYVYAVTKHETYVYLSINRGKDTEKETKAIYDQLLSAKDDIERAFGEPLEWKSSEEHRTCSIQKCIKMGG